MPISMRGAAFVAALSGPLLGAAQDSASVVPSAPAGRATAQPRPQAATAGGATPAKPGKPADTTAKRKRVGGLGPVSGNAHLAYKDMGSDLDSLWPPKMPAPLPGAILPNRRVIAFYGNPLSRRMGILGEFDPPEMFAKLDAEVAAWNRLDPAHPVQPALHLSAVVAQGAPGRDGKDRLRMDSAFIERVYGWAQQKKAILFLDVQVGHSTLQQELPWLERFLKRPDVHLGIDPEFSMKDGKTAPGRKIGTFDAADINYASKFLQDLVTKHTLPPKMLVVHRFTRKGVTNAKQIKLDARVQVVMHMDGFGAPWLKRDSYYSYIKQEPVQYAGWKQFTKPKNDNPPTSREEILRLWPQPVYIQVQ
ncbi:MAG: hypothetical protein ACK6DK_03710 [Gemmatimonadota bacterium]